MISQKNISDIALKKLQYEKIATNEDTIFTEEEYVSRNAVPYDIVWINSDLIPYMPGVTYYGEDSAVVSLRTGNNLATYNVSNVSIVTKLANVCYNYVEGTDKTFAPSPLLDPTCNVLIPDSYGKGYFPKIMYENTSNVLVPISFGSGSFNLDYPSGVLRFYKDLPPGMSLSSNVYVTVYKYTGGTLKDSDFTGSKGDKGSSGTQGYQGTQGTQGIAGTASAKGDQGYQGPIGTQGTQGTQGVQGMSGSASAKGDQGYQGSVGPQGDQGPVGTGTQGVQGIQGPIGTQGTQGVQGPIGTQGTQGVQGPIGTQGTQGVQGPQGTGDQGPQGTQGICPPCFTGNITNTSVGATSGSSPAPIAATFSPNNSTVLITPTVTGIISGGAVDNGTVLSVAYSDGSSGPGFKKGMNFVTVTSAVNEKYSLTVTDNGVTVINNYLMDNGITNQTFGVVYDGTSYYSMKLY